MNRSKCCNAEIEDISGKKYCRRCERLLKDPVVYSEFFIRPYEGDPTPPTEGIEPPITTVNIDSDKLMSSPTASGSGFTPPTEGLAWLDEVLSKLEVEIEVEGCQASHDGDMCLHCNISPCPHCRQWGGRDRIERVFKPTKEQVAHAITTKLREVIKSAKPETRSVPPKEQVLTAIDAWADGMTNQGWNNSANQYEANLLKQLGLEPGEDR